MLCPSLLEESKSIQESKVDIALFDKPVVNVCDLLCIVLVQLGHPHAENLRLKKMTICDRKSYVMFILYYVIVGVTAAILAQGHRVQPRKRLYMVAERG